MKTVGSQGRLIKVLEMLKQESDDEHPLSTNDIIDKLSKLNISADRRTIYNDIDTLNNMGIEVLTRKGRNQSNLYYVVDRTFDETEIGIIIDAIQATSFITEKKTKELTHKIANLAGSNQGEVLKEAKIDFNTTKHTNEEIYYNISQIQEAISKKKKLSFIYFKLDENRNKVYKRNGERYVVSPVATVLNDNNYYFYAYDKDEKAVKTFRIDRMLRVDVENQKIDKEAIEKKKQVSANKIQCFGMFSGEEKTVSFEFDQSLIDVMYDKFGEKIPMNRVGDRVTCTHSVMVSDQFFGWCCGFSQKLKVTFPKEVVSKLKEYIDNLSKNYED